MDRDKEAQAVLAQFEDVEYEPLELDWIEYPSLYARVFGLLRKVSNAQDMTCVELSERMLDLTTVALNLNAADFSVWTLRRFMLSRVPLCSRARWQREAEQLSGLMIKQQKNYQVWNHRRAVVLALIDDVISKKQCVEDEKAFVEMVLRASPKNYHAWSHLQWLVGVSGDAEGEMAFTERMLDDDYRNNSAWNHRFFVLGRFKNQQAVRNDIPFALCVLQKARDNESCWNYLLALAGLAGDLEAWKSVKAQASSIVDQLPGQSLDSKCRRVEILARSALVRCGEAIVQLSFSDDELGHVRVQCAELVRLDSIRTQYWAWRGSEMDKMSGRRTTTTAHS
ncbi:Protein farnesyltransferase/geranylgeranyltransferase type-1 subunit alpha [Porphyridium purpureum]|uniref:Protein farnesyltransferase/geranylgeranyltransferase type-1 subunit alpha n=1 Tax=Porphyridium purpureum TaxID=35688 RepID=A0A5J4Z607_PORPP|nr:Protein farnesyltransferase/geranylgeranyltransferase type-1 subunit alpha [Porphyridium purpureum]|eukprot:POR0645..scf295_1